MNNIATHNSPAWGPRSNFIIRADLSSDGMPGRLEQLWVRKIEPTVFEICCIPFFTYGLALGDKVQSSSDYTIQNITEKGGHKTLRIAVANQEKQDYLHQVLHDWVESTGLLYEWYAPGYLAVDLPPDVHGREELSALDQWSEIGAISIEIDVHEEA